MYIYLCTKFKLTVFVVIYS